MSRCLCLCFNYVNNDNKISFFGITQTKTNRTVMPLSTMFQLYRGGQFYCLWKPEYQEKTIGLPQVTDKLDGICVAQLFNFLCRSEYS